MKTNAKSHRKLIAVIGIALIVAGITRTSRADNGDFADKSKFTKIDVPGAAGTTEAFGINPQGDIVGTYFAVSNEDSPTFRVPSQPDVSMQICFVIALVGLTINFASPDFAQQKDTVDAETAQQVRALASNYDAAFNRQDAVTIAGLYAQDAVFNTPEGTFHGRQAPAGSQIVSFSSPVGVPNDISKTLGSLLLIAPF